MYPTATGYPDYSSSGSTGFIPEIWAGKLVEKFYPATVFGEIANTDYEGEIQNQGDTVNIRTRATITIRDYKIGESLQTEKPQSDKVPLNIDKGKYFAFEINDVVKTQSDRNLLDEWGEDASEQMAVKIDKDILANIYANVDSANSGSAAGAESGDINLGATGSPVSLTKANILDFIVDLGTVLDEQNVPQSGRWLTLPAWACGLIKKSDLKDASLAGDGTSILRNGRMGMIDRFTLYNSNNLETVTDGANQVTNIIAGHKAGLTFASQMTEMEQIPNPNDFGQIVRGLQVYGYKVIEGKYLAHLYATKG